MQVVGIVAGLCAALYPIVVVPLQIAASGERRVRAAGRICYLALTAAYSCVGAAMGSMVIRVEATFKLPDAIEQ